MNKYITSSQYVRKHFPECRYFFLYHHNLTRQTVTVALDINFSVLGIVDKWGIKHNFISHNLFGSVIEFYGNRFKLLTLYNIEKYMNRDDLILYWYYGQRTNTKFDKLVINFKISDNKFSQEFVNITPKTLSKVHFFKKVESQALIYSEHYKDVYINCVCGDFSEFSKQFPIKVK